MASTEVVEIRLLPGLDPEALKRVIEFLKKEKGYKIWTNKIKNSEDSPISILICANVPEKIISSTFYRAAETHGLIYSSIEAIFEEA